MKIPVIVKMSLKKQFHIKGRRWPWLGCVVFSRSGEPKVYVDLSLHGRWYRRNHRSTEQLIQEIISTIDHEYAHTFEPPNATSDLWEPNARQFERAGRWARGFSPTPLVRCGSDGGSHQTRMREE